MPKKCPQGYHLNAKGNCVPNVGNQPPPPPPAPAPTPNCPPGYHWAGAKAGCVRNAAPPPEPTPEPTPEPEPVPEPEPEPKPWEERIGRSEYEDLIRGMGGSWMNPNFKGKDEGPGGGGDPEHDYGAYVRGLMGATPGGDIFGDLVDQAILEGWTTEEFIQRVYGSEQFRMIFPGLVRPDGSLRMTPLEYRGLADAYRSIAADYGISMNDFRIGLLVSGAVSPDEFAVKAQAIQNVRNNPGLMENYNEQLRQYGYAPLDAQGFMRLVAGMGSPDYYDVYEAALLRSSTGVNVSAEEAAQTARAVGTPGTPTDIAGIVNQLRLMKADIAPELARAGITDADIIKLEAGVDPKGIAPAISSIIANRRAKGGYIPGSQARIGSGGGVATEPQERAKSYG